MTESGSYENYPLWIVLLSNAVSLSIYVLGFAIMFRLGWIVPMVYLVYILFLEFRLLSSHCPNCYYFGKACGFGKGRISALFFKKGDSSKFCAREMKWKDMIPDLLVSLIPFITAIVLLIVEFDFVTLTALIVLTVLTTKGNELIRGKLVCAHCKQRELGCPALALFGNGEKKPVHGGELV